VEMAQGTLHQYVVSNRFDAATFALYSIGCLQIPFVELLAGPACNVMMVRMAEARRRGDTAALHASFLDTTRKLALFFFPLFGLLFVAGADLIVFLFTDVYASAATLFRLWCLSVLLAVFQTDGILRVLAETKHLVVVNLVRLALTVALVGPLLHSLGLVGPAAATLFALAVAKGLMLVRYRRRLARPGRELLPWLGLLRIGGAALFAALVALLVSAAMDHEAALARLLAVSVSYSVTYAALLLLTPALTPGERQALHSRLGRAKPCVESPGS